MIRILNFIIRWEFLESIKQVGDMIYVSKRYILPLSWRIDYEGVRVEIWSGLRAMEAAQVGADWVRVAEGGSG